jgi:hypothetical protein
MSTRKIGIGPISNFTADESEMADFSAAEF